MVGLGVFVQLEAKPEKTRDVEELLAAPPIVEEVDVLAYTLGVRLPHFSSSHALIPKDGHDE
jgi:hypothetical protein